MPLPVKLVTVAAALPLSMMSVTRLSNSVISSLNVMVTLNAPVAVIGAVIVTLGIIVSTGTVYSDDAVFPLAAASCAVPAGT